MLLFFGWILGAVIIGAIGSGRKIGFLGAFFFSLLLSPLIGIIITMLSPSAEDEAYKKEILQATKNLSLLKAKDENAETVTQTNTVHDLEVLHDLMTKGILTEEEYLLKKTKILEN